MSSVLKKADKLNLSLSLLFGMTKNDKKDIGKIACWLSILFQLKLANLL